MVHNLIKTKTALTDQEIQDVAKSLGSILCYGTYTNINDEKLINNICNDLGICVPNKKLLTYSDFYEISTLLGYENDDLKKGNFVHGLEPEEFLFMMGNRCYDVAFDGLLHKDVADHIIKVI